MEYESPRAFVDQVRTAFDLLPNAVSIHGDWSFQYVNQAFATMLGAGSPESFLGHNLCELIHPDDLPRSRERLATLYSGKPLIDPASVRLLTREGRELPTEILSNPIRCGDGWIVVSCLRDVSEQEQSAAATRHYAETASRIASEWVATFDAVLDPVLLVDSMVLRVNLATRDLLELPFQEIIGMQVGALPGTPLWQTVTAAARSCIECGRAVSLSARDEEKSWDVGANPVGDSRGGRRVVVVARDVTRLLTLQESLRRAETFAAIGALTAAVAHEVRNPLFGISAVADALEARPEAAPFTQHLSVLRGEVARLQEFMRGLLEYSRPAAPELTIGTLRGATEAGIRNVGALIRAKEVTVVIRDKADDLPVRLDKGRLPQVVENLVSNAAHVSPRESRVEIVLCAVERDGRRFGAIQVLDEGPGFPEDDLPRVFEPFFSRRRGGIGLGLWIVQRIVEEHGGIVEASNREGGGGRVTVLLPVVFRRKTKWAEES